MTKIKKRSEIKVEYTWDLSSLYKNTDAWEVDFKKAKKLIEKIGSFQGSVMDSEKSLLKTLEKRLELNRILGNLFTYAKMRQDENTKLDQFQEMTARAESLSVQAGTAMAYIVPEIMAAKESRLWHMVDNFKPLELYRHDLEDTLRAKPHILSEKEERLLALAGDMASAPSNIFGMINVADFKFPVVKDKDENEISLSHGNFIPTLQSKDRTLRKNAFSSFYKIYANHENALAMMIQSEVKKNVFYANARNHKTAREASLHKNNVDVMVYDNLIEQVNKHLPSLHKYMALRKKVLKLDSLHMYDVHTPIVDNVDMAIPYKKAKEMVLRAMAPLGEDYCKTVEKGFEERWIDVYETEGKRNGAYSWGTYDSNPFILLNYHDTLDNTFTLIHELGHSMHSYFTHNHQPYLYGHYSIFLAEVASTTNEVLLTHHLLDTLKDGPEKLYVLNHYLESFRNTVYRQTMFAEFERDIHTIVESGGALTPQMLKTTYRALNEKYYGPHMVVDKEIDWEWARIPHFYYNFYVFQYATGFSAAVALAQGLLENKSGSLEAYHRFLQAGSSQYPLEILKQAGADMTSASPIDKALKRFGELLEDMERLLEK